MVSEIEFEFVELPASFYSIVAAGLSAAAFWYMAEGLRRIGASRGICAVACWLGAFALAYWTSVLDRTQVLGFVAGGAALGGFVVGFLVLRRPPIANR